MSNPMMKCGHAANAVVAADNAPFCVICGCGDVDEKPASLAGRMAKCSYLTKRNGKPHDGAVRSVDLPFFESKPDEPFDVYYCGCWGWD
jgi:hypothetical protein